MKLSPERKRRLVQGAKIATLAVLAWGMHATLGRAVADLAKPEFARHLWHIKPLWLVLSGLLYLLGTLPSALFSYRLLVAMQQPVRLPAVLRAFYISQMGKYVPGKAMVIVLRTSLLGAARVEKTVVAASVFIDTLTTMACGALLATAAVAWHDPAKTGVMLAGLGMFLAMGVPSIPAVFAWIAGSLGIGRINPRAAERLRAIGWDVIVVGWFSIAVGWLVQGMSLWAVLRAVGATDEGPLANWALHSAAAALAVVVGFLTMIPGGLVGREFVLTELTAPVYGAALAALSALVLRLAWLVAEILVSSILYFLGGRSQHPPAEGSEWSVP